MEEAGKKFYTISEAAKIKGISENEIFCGIAEEKIKTKKIGLRVMIPASFIFEETKQKSQNRAEKYFEQLKPIFIKILEEAPEYGCCGLVVTFHEGKIVKKNKIYEETRLEDKSNDNN